MFRPWTKITFLAAGLLVSARVSFGAALTNGDVFASVGPGLVNEYTPTGVFVQSLNTGHTVYTATGSAFSPANGDFYVTGFGQNTVVRFSSATGAKVSDFATTQAGSDDESISFDAAGNSYVGQADGTHNVLEFNPSGALINTFAPATQDRGTDWVDLAADQHTLYYTSEGTAIKRYDTATHTQLGDFTAAPLPGGVAYALRILANGDVLVADSTHDYLLDSSGNVIRTYTLPGNSGVLFALNIDPNGTSFWTGDAGNNNLWEVDIATGAIQEHWVPSGATGQLAGLAIKGELTAATTPEPSQLVMSIVLVGLLAMFGYWRKRKATEIVSRP